MHESSARLLIPLQRVIEAVGTQHGVITRNAVPSESAQDNGGAYSATALTVSMSAVGACCDHSTTITGLSRRLTASMIAVANLRA